MQPWQLRQLRTRARRRLMRRTARAIVMMAALHAVPRHLVGKPGEQSANRRLTFKNHQVGLLLR